MNEKKYLLTESDISKIGQLECESCAANAAGRFDCSETLDAERHRMLEAHEYREPDIPITVHDIPHCPRCKHDAYGERGRSENGEELLRCAGCGVRERLPVEKADGGGGAMNDFERAIWELRRLAENDRLEEERKNADSLEAVALDAYDLAKRATWALFMTTVGVEVIDAVFIDLAQEEAAIESRLKALGVVR